MSLAGIFVSVCLALHVIKRKCIFGFEEVPTGCIKIYFPCYIPNWGKYGPQSSHSESEGKESSKYAINNLTKCIKK